jgi:hypothetical protein
MSLLLRIPLAYRPQRLLQRGYSEKHFKNIVQKVNEDGYMSEEALDPADEEWSDTVEWPEEDWDDDYWDDSISDTEYF